MYEYDRGGNITAKMRYAYTTGTVGALLQIIPYIYNATWKDKLATYNGQTITSDAIGNTLNDGTWTYYWEMGRRLWQMEKGNYGDPNSVLMNFNYNAEGVRVGKLCDSHDASGNNSYVYTDYYVHGKKIMHMTQSGNNLHFFYDAQGRPAVVNYNGTKYAYILNLQGDVLGLRNSSGTEVVKYTYDAWGKILSATGSMASSLGKLNPFRYRGYVYDEETGLYYLQSRYYNPEWGRFINADNIIPISRDLTRATLWGYCGNNPIKNQDSTGKWFGFDDLVTGAVDEIIVLGGLGLLSLFGVKSAQHTLNNILNTFISDPAKKLSQSNAIEAGISDIAGSFENLYCKEAADAVSGYLKKKKKKHNLVTLTFENAFNGFVVSNKNPNIAISENGFHYGIEYNGNVYCNVYPTGLPFNVWVNSFSAIDANTGRDIKPKYFITPLY